MREVTHELNQRILSGMSDKQLETTAGTLDAMKRNLLTYLQATEA